MSFSCRPDTATTRLAHTTNRPNRSRCVAGHDHAGEEEIGRQIRADYGVCLSFIPR
jgi:hypothetical protein